MIRKETFEARAKQGGCGKGECYICELVSKEDMMGHARLFAKVIVPPGASIGYHTHHKETEPYFILSGEGDFKDENGVVTKVHAGDICTIPEGGSHGMENNGTEDLVFIALIYNMEPAEYHGGITF